MRRAATSLMRHVLTHAMQQTASSHSSPCQRNERPLETHVVYLRTCSESDHTRLKILVPQDFPACRGSGHRILARIAHLCHVRFYAGLDPAFAGLNAGAQFLDIVGAGFPACATAAEPDSSSAVSYDKPRSHACHLRLPPKRFKNAYPNTSESRLQSTPWKADGIATGQLFLT
jgi:hypothetical protein